MSKKINIQQKKDVFKSSKNDKITHPVFCFKYLTSNKNYNFDYFNTDNEKVLVYKSLFDKLFSISSYSWIEFIGLSKNVGLETIKYSSFNFNINNFELSKDDKLISIRFCSQKYRIIGIKSKCNDCVFHILGFDFDYSAYKHS